MREFEYIGDALHEAGELVPVVERTPTDLFTSSGHGLFSAGGVAGGGLAGGGAHAALAFGGKALATVASTASLASGIVFGNQILAPNHQDAASANTVSVAAGDGVTTEGGTQAGALPGSTLDDSGVGGSVLGAEANNPFLGISPASLHNAASAFQSGDNVTQLSGPSAQLAANVGSSQASASPSPSASQEPARISTVVASPAPSASQSSGDGGGTGLALPALPALDFGHTSSATPTAAAAGAAGNSGSGSGGNYAINVGSGSGGSATHTSSATPTVGAVAAAGGGVSGGSSSGSTSGSVQRAFSGEREHEQEHESEHKERKGSRD